MGSRAGWTVLGKAGDVGLPDLGAPGLVPGREVWGKENQEKGGESCVSDKEQPETRQSRRPPFPSTAAPGPRRAVHPWGGMLQGGLLPSLPLGPVLTDRNVPSLSGDRAAAGPSARVLGGLRPRLWQSPHAGVTGRACAARSREPIPGLIALLRVFPARRRADETQPIGVRGRGRHA